MDNVISATVATEPSAVRELVDKLDGQAEQEDFGF